MLQGQQLPIYVTFLLCTLKLMDKKDWEKNIVDPVAACGITCGIMSSSIKILLYIFKCLLPPPFDKNLFMNAAATPQNDNISQHSCENVTNNSQHSCEILLIIVSTCMRLKISVTGSALPKNPFYRKKFHKKLYSIWLCKRSPQNVRIRFYIPKTP